MAIAPEPNNFKKRELRPTNLEIPKIKYYY